MKVDFPNMDSETEYSLIREPAPCPYELTSMRLRIPDDGIRATLQLLRLAGRRESGLFWYGERDEQGNGTVSYIVAPRQHMTWGNYYIPPDAMGEVVSRLEECWKPLAQIHSHPGARVEHSRYDDEMTSIKRALSLVFPYYGRRLSKFPNAVGVHEWQNSYWHLLNAEQAAIRIINTDGVVRTEDLRWKA